MNETLSENAVTVLESLRGIVRGVADAKPVPSEPDYHFRWRCWARDHREIEGGIPSRMAVEAWAGGYADANQRRRFWRAVDELESAGLVARHCHWDGRCTHLRLPEPETAP